MLGQCASVIGRANVLSCVSILFMSMLNVDIFNLTQSMNVGYSYGVTNAITASEGVLAFLQILISTV